MAQRLLSLLITLALPFLLVVLSIRLVANPWFIHLEYNRPGFPPDPYGFTTAQRTSLAMDGLYSVLPEGEGLIRLQQAKLPDGGSAFTERESKHMQDVRVLMAQVFPLMLIGWAMLVILALVFNRVRGWRHVVPTGLRGGAVLTLTLLAVLIAYIVLNFDSFFLTFHRLFFEGDTFLFLYTDTLIRLYPEQLWSDVSILIGGLTVVMTLVVLAISQVWVRRIGESANQRER
jgi:integral membrane protein (TIGR01906 family)